VLPQAAGQSRNPARRLASLGDGGVDEQDVGDGFSPCIGENRFLGWRILSYLKPSAGSLQHTAQRKYLSAVYCCLSHQKIGFDKAEIVCKLFKMLISPEEI
jgi:hypothetical protein